MKKFTRKKSIAIRKMFIGLALCAVPWMAFSYMKVEKGDWVLAAAICLVIYMILWDKDVIFKEFDDESGKYIEITDTGLKLVEPSENYEAIVRFSQISRVKIYSDEKLVTKLSFHLKNQQRFSLSGYDGLTEVAEKVRRIKGVVTIES